MVQHQQHANTLAHEAPFVQVFPAYPLLAWPSSHQAVAWYRNMAQGLGTPVLEEQCLNQGTVPQCVKLSKQNLGPIIPLEL